MGFLTTLLDSNTLPWVTALILGLMTAISPCPLATNITAIGFICKDMSNRNRVFINGLLYTLGRAITYTLIAVILFLGADQLKFSGFFQLYGEKIIGPLLILIGLFMLDVIKIRSLGLGRISERLSEKREWHYFDALLLGLLFALAFCPYSGVLYFGMLIPMTITSASGLYLPLLFALATGIPVIVISWIIAYSVSGIGRFYNRVKSFELWFRRIVAVVFILAGAYYVIRVFILV